jgi:CheY-like chemotaxis protein
MTGGKVKRVTMIIERKVCLLIDDDRDDREIFSIAMGEVSDDIDVLTLDNAMDAIYKIREGEVKPDLIFLDLNMPGTNGYQVLVYLKGQIRYRKIPVIVYSTTNDPEEVKRTKKLGAAAFFIKPAKFSELRQQLFELLSDSKIFNRHSLT